MTERPTEFSYHSIELCKSESLGSGSYGGVCKAKCDGLLCAAKIMHPTLFDLHDPGTTTYLRKFQEECCLLSLARHPNIVQYLGTYTDPDTRLPVLLMELCEESLTAFLERSPGPLMSYHVQVNICHDIALALVYLHSNGLIHRDLTGNNVLMVSGPRAKITDFGVSKLSSINPRMTAFTLCPGNVLYMPPEALDEAKSYTAKLDIFSFGVIVIQILTRQFPAPTNRFQNLQVPGVDGDIRLLVPDKERRKVQLNLIPDAHVLKPLALQCLNKKDSDRPSAQELSGRLSELKQTSLYTESSVRQAQNESDTQQLEVQLQEEKNEFEEHRKRIKDIENELTESQASIITEDQALHAKQRELQLIGKQLQASEQLVSKFQQSLQQNHKIITDLQQCLHQKEMVITDFQLSMQQKAKTIFDLQQTILTHERKIQRLEQQDAASGDQRGEESVTIPQPTVAAAEEEDGGKVRWRKGTDAPQVMWRGAAAVHGNIAYFISYDSYKVYSYQNIIANEQWCQLPDNPTMNCGLAVIDGLLTSVGGSKINGFSNTLCSLRGEGESKGWCNVFPPMPTPRDCVLCVTTKEALVVAGGREGFFSRPSNNVEVMNINTKQWSFVSPLPKKCTSPSATIICGDSLYLVGGYLSAAPKSVFTSSLPDLISSNSQSCNVWREISDLLVEGSTLASFGGDLLAIGGYDDLLTTTSNVFKYDSNTDTWKITSEMSEKRYHCLAVTLPGEILVVVGGGVCRLLIPDKGTKCVELLI